MPSILRIPHVRQRTTRRYPVQLRFQPQLQGVDQRPGNRRVPCSHPGIHPQPAGLGPMADSATTGGREPSD